MFFTEQMSQAISVPVLSFSPANTASNNTTASTMGPITMSRYRRIMAHVVAGVLSANTNVQAYFQGCNTSNGTYANVSGGNTLTLSASNTEGTLEMRADQMPAGNQFLQLALLVSGGANTGAFLSAQVYGGASHYRPAAQFDGGNSTTLQRLVQ